jgi:hypothetical protein
MKPENAQTYPISSIEDDCAGRTRAPTDEEVHILELSIEDLEIVGGGGVKDHSI